MPRGKTLSIAERAKIQAYKDVGLSNRKIATKIGRSLCAINNFLNLKDNYDSKKRSGRKPTISPRQKREIIRKATKEHLVASKIKSDMNLPVSTRHVRRILSSNKNLKWSKRQGKPKLTDRHKEKRIDFARNHMNFGDEWKSVVFSDEKKN